MGKGTKPTPFEVSERFREAVMREEKVRNAHVANKRNRRAPSNLDYSYFKPCEIPQEKKEVKRCIYDEMHTDPHATIVRKRQYPPNDGQYRVPVTAMGEYGQLPPLEKYDSQHGRVMIIKSSFYRNNDVNIQETETLKVQS
eukprot:Nk52_evm87s1810 gene=Nk52_evmTU87s1810